MKRALLIVTNKYALSSSSSILSSSSFVVISIDTQRDNWPSRYFKHHEKTSSRYTRSSASFSHFFFLRWPFFSSLLTNPLETSRKSVKQTWGKRNSEEKNGTKKKRSDTHTPPESLTECCSSSFYLFCLSHVTTRSSPSSPPPPPPSMPSSLDFDGLKNKKKLIETHRYFCERTTVQHRSIVIPLSSIIQVFSSAADGLRLKCIANDRLLSSLRTQHAIVDSDFRIAFGLYSRLNFVSDLCKPMHIAGKSSVAN